MSTSAGIVKVETTAKGGPAIPFTTAVSSPPVANLFGVAQGWQTLGVFSNILTVQFPNVPPGGHAQVTFKEPLTSFPQTLQVPKGAQSIIVVSLSLPKNVPQLGIFTPNLSMVFGSGTPIQNAGQSAFTLQAGRTYRAPTVSGTLTALYLQALLNPIDVDITLQAILLGLPT